MWSFIGPVPVGGILGAKIDEVWDARAKLIDRSYDPVLAIVLIGLQEQEFKIHYGTVMSYADAAEKLLIEYEFQVTSWYEDDEYAYDLPE